MNYVENILRVHAEAAYDELEHGLTWYSQAKDTCQGIADRTELPLRVVVGVLAALSPTNRWERNVIDAAALCTAFVTGGYMEDVSVCTYKKMKEKAWTILEAAPVLGVKDTWAIAEILKGPKITDFFWCIMGFDTCVIDGHAWCIANDDRRTMQEVPNIGKKLRNEIQDAYQEAGKEVGITAYQMQAITWVTWKRIHNV